MSWTKVQHHTNVWSHSLTCSMISLLGKKVDQVIDVNSAKYSLNHQNTTAGD